MWDPSSFLFFFFKIFDPSDCIWISRWDFSLCQKHALGLDKDYIESLDWFRGSIIILTLLILESMNMGYFPVFIVQVFQPLWVKWKKKKILFIYFLETGKGREKEKARTIDLLPLTRILTGDQNCNPGMFSGWGLNPWPFALWNDAQPTKPHQSGLDKFIFMYFILFNVNVNGWF